MESCLLLEFHTILRNKAATSAPTSYSQPVEPPRKVQHQHQQRANSQLRKAMILQQKFLTLFPITHWFKTNHTKQDHQKINLAPDHLRSTDLFRLEFSSSKDLGDTAPPAHPPQKQIANK